MECILGLPRCARFGNLRTRFSQGHGQPKDTVTSRSRLKYRAVLFVDLRGYTTLCEGIDPDSVVDLLDEFYAVIGGAVAALDGAVLNLAGDSVMAVFGQDGASASNNGRDAVASARKMIEGFQPLGARWEQRYGVTTGIGIGVHAGVVGEAELGPASLRRPTFVGDTVNVAARLCHRARAGEVLFSAEVASGLRDADCDDIIPLPNFSLRGRIAPVQIFCVPALERMDLRLSL